MQKESLMEQARLYLAREAAVPSYLKSLAAAHNLRDKCDRIAAAALQAVTVSSPKSVVERVIEFGEFCPELLCAFPVAVKKRLDGVFTGKKDDARSYLLCMAWLVYRRVVAPSVIFYAAQQMEHSLVKSDMRWYLALFAALEVCMEELRRHDLNGTRAMLKKIEARTCSPLASDLLLKSKTAAVIALADSKETKTAARPKHVETLEVLVPRFAKSERVSDVTYALFAKELGVVFTLPGPKTSLPVK